MAVTDEPAVNTAHAALVNRGNHLFANLPLRDVEIAEDTLTMELDNRPDLTNDRGALQGGLVATLIDIVGGRLAFNRAGPGRGVATADMNIHFTSAIIEGPASATATIVRHGRRTILVSVEVTDLGARRLAALATLTFSILEPRAAS